MAHYDETDLIYQTDHFVLTRSQRPYVSREEGGHLRIFAKRQGIKERRDFTPAEAVDFIRLSSAAGQALERGMRQRGVDIVIVNLEELGNWAYKYNSEPKFHEHIFGRARDAKNKFSPEAVQLPDRDAGFYDNFLPLDDDDMRAVRAEIEAIMQSPKFANTAEWHA